MLDSSPIIAILRGVRPDEVVEIGEALFANGITRIEVPLNSPEAPLESISRLVTHFGARAEIGAGTVLNVEAVDAVKATGASYVVSPNCVPAVVARARALGMGAFPGVITPDRSLCRDRCRRNRPQDFPRRTRRAGGHSRDAGSAAARYAGLCRQRRLQPAFRRLHRCRRQRFRARRPGLFAGRYGGNSAGQGTCSDGTVRQGALR